MPVRPPSANARSASHHTRLPAYLALAYVVLVIYASLHPFSGWRDPGLSPWVFIDAAWPRYWTVFDLVINALAYVPLCFFVALAARRRLPAWLGSLVGALFGAGLSFALECTQSWLPSRVPSNLDLASNALGALLGALLAWWLGARLLRRTVHAQRELLSPLPHVEVGLVLVGLWLLTLLSPEIFLFSGGDLRHLLPITPVLAYRAPSFVAMEAVIVACHAVAIGLIVRALLGGRRSPYIILPLFFLLALGVRMLAAIVLVNPGAALAWLTPGALLGLGAGVGVLVLALMLPGPWRIALAGLALMAGTVLVNLTPPNPYSVAALAAWRQGHFLNFNGLTRLTASLWPFLALPALILLGRRS